MGVWILSMLSLLCITTHVRASGYFPPVGTWRVATPASQGMNAARLTALCTFTKHTDPVSSVLVIRHGYVVLNCGPTGTPRAVASTSKSLSGLAHAHAFQAGVLHPNDALYPYLPASWGMVSGHRQIQVKHVLNMTSGLFPHDKPRSAPGYYETAFSLGMVASPGEQWAYASAPIDIASVVFRNATGRSVHEYLNVHIFSRIGAGTIGWDTFCSVAGACFTRASSGAKLTAYQMARVGYLLLKDGMWGTQRLVSAAEVDRITQWDPALATASGDGPQHYYTARNWWTNIDGRAMGKNIPRDAFLAGGNRGNHLVIIPSLDLIYVRTAGNVQPAGFTLWWDFLQHMIGKVVSALPGYSGIP